VTCLARGESGAVPRGGVRFVRSEGELLVPTTRSAGSDWDEVSSSLRRRPVTGALEALADNTQHWTLVSSVSVYVSKQRTER
jgi:hypothetical protein